jgi:hypothetical protein
VEPILFQGRAREHGDAALALAVGTVLDMAVPDACVPGVAANVRLIEDHIATMRQPAEPDL